ncbi:YceI family protein [Zhouia sp. PK063]|uniref:YceI family protein n=1 Tax=Zhouia sp. PK063 TaxID=3373602 RepID=UPI00379079E1
MKLKLLTPLAIAACIAFTSCKDKKNETTTEDAAIVAEASAEALTYTVDTTASIIDWKGSKPTGNHTGTINVKSGTVTVKNDSLESGSFVIDMNSITDTDLKPGEGKEDLEAHLKGSVPEKMDHFFNVKEYPEGKFEVTGLTNVDGKDMLEGNLTLKDTTKKIAFPVKITFDGDTMLLDSETFTIDRTKWNVNYGSKTVFDNLGDKFINDDIELTVHVRATK